MSFIEVFMLAIGLSMDAFAVAICLGLAMEKASLKNAVIVGLYFGIFQVIMPLTGFFTASLFADAVMALSHWIAFALLAFIGGKMLIGSFRKDGEKETTYISIGFKVMLPLAVATSIDALAVGVSFAFLYVNIIPAVLLIGFTTFVISAAGVITGSVFGARFKAKAEFAGGLILILIGLRILLSGSF